MKRFSNKQLREEVDGLREQVQSFPDIRLRPVGMLLHADMIEFLMKAREKDAARVQLLAKALRGMIEHVKANFRDTDSCWVQEAKNALAEAGLDKEPA